VGVHVPHEAAEDRVVLLAEHFRTAERIRKNVVVEVVRNSNQGGAQEEPSDEHGARPGMVGIQQLDASDPLPAEHAWEGNVNAAEEAPFHDAAYAREVTLTLFDDKVLGGAFWHRTVL
jgi:hypothetical protein